MYITINNIKGEKRIDLSYSIQNFDSDKEIAVIRMLSDNVKYEILKLRAVMDPISDAKKMIPNVSVNSNWVHPPGQPPGISSKTLHGGLGFDF